MLVSQLPSPNFFILRSSKNDKFVWQDEQTDFLRIQASTKDIWGKEVGLVLLISNGKTRAGNVYPRQLTLKVVPIEPTFKRVKILREHWKGNFASSLEPSLNFFAFAIPKTKESDYNWLMLSVIEN